MSVMKGLMDTQAQLISLWLPTMHRKYSSGGGKWYIKYHVHFNTVTVIKKITSLPIQPFSALHGIVLAL